MKQRYKNNSYKDKWLTALIVFALTSLLWGGLWAYILGETIRTHNEEIKQITKQLDSVRVIPSYK